MIHTETQIGWQDYLAVILRRRWFFIIPCAVIVAGGLILGLFMPRIYRAETIILAQEPNIMNPLIQGLAVTTPVGARLGTLREEILSWTSLSRLVHELKLDQPIKHPVAFERLIKELQQNIQVLMRGRDLIRISYEHEDPKLAQQLVNTVSAIFLDRNVAAQSAETGGAIGFLDRELAVYQGKLEGSERALREFRELYATQMPVAVELNNQIVQLEIQLANLLIENTEQHPAVVEVKRRLQDLKTTRNAEIKRFIASSIAKGHDAALFKDLVQALDQSQPQPAADPKIRLAQEAYAAWVERLDNPSQLSQAAGPQVQVVTEAETGAARFEVIGAGPASISLAPWQEQELARLTRDSQVNASTYQHLKQRLERANLTQRLGESDEGLKFKILEPARLPLKPVKPNMVKIVFFALLLGVFVGAGVAFAAEYLDQSFQSAEEVQVALAAPVLGSISTIVTEADIERRRQRIKAWVSVQRWKTTLEQGVRPILSRIDQQLLKWGL